jgi:hypothetical protein
MTSTIKNRTLGAAALLAVLLGSAACGTDTVSDTDPGNQPAAKPATAPSGHYAESADSAERKAAASSSHPAQSADSAERKAAEQKAREDRASTLRWDRGQVLENKLNSLGNPGRP